MAILHRKHQCMSCAAEVTANFDHVGDCEGDCRGTFEHPRGDCKNAGTDIPHSRVYTTTTGTRA
jgi:hypothetical protein